MVIQEKYKRLETVLKAESEKKEKEDRSRLPDPPKTAQDIWQQSVIGDYLARFKVHMSHVVMLEYRLCYICCIISGPLCQHVKSEPPVLQNDRPKAQKAMEATWGTMEKKEKIMWIKKAAEDQKRYEVGCHCCPHPAGFSSYYLYTQPMRAYLEFICPLQRDLCEMRSPAAAIASGKKMKFEGEPKKPPSYVKHILLMHPDSGS